MKQGDAAVLVTVLGALVMAQPVPVVAAEQVTVTTSPTAVQVSNGLWEATLSADRLHLTGLRLAGGENLNLLQRVVTIYHTGQWQEEDSSPAYGRWETHLDRRPEVVVASTQTSDAFFVHRRTIQVRTGAPHLEVRYSWQCRKTFRTATYYSIPDICFAKELDEAVWEGAEGRMEKVLALQDGQASPAWEEARGQYTSALAIGGHWFAARSTAQDVGLLVFLPTREGVGARASTGYTWDPRVHLSIAPPMGRRPNPPMAGETVESHFFLLPFRGAAEEAVQALIKLLPWKRPEPPRPAPGALAYPLAQTPQVTLWHETIMAKVGRNHPPPRGRARPVIDLTAAQDEYEATQVVCVSPGRLSGFSLFAGDLIGATATIPASHVEINPVGYVRTASPPGEFPDLLLPNRKVDLSPGRAQPFWVTVHVPRDAPAGRYQGDLTFVAVGLEPIHLTLRLTVYGFALPPERHLHAPFGFRPGYLAVRYGSEQCWPVLEAYGKEFVRARLTWSVHVTPPAPLQALDEAGKYQPPWFDDWAQRTEKVIREFSCNTFWVPHRPTFPPGVRFEGPKESHGRGELDLSPEAEAAWQAFYREVEAAAERKGVLRECYNFLIDEPVPEAVPNVKYLAQMTRAGAPKTKIMVTIAPTPELYGLVDVWCLGSRGWPFWWSLDHIADTVPSMVPPPPPSGGRQGGVALPEAWSFDRASQLIRERQAVGEEVWWGDGPACCDLVAEGMEPRMLLWSTWRFGLQGLLLWSVNLWTENPWAGWDDDRLTLRWPRSFPASGDGVLLYPGPTGDLPPVRSIRWELLREGLEDFEYLYLVQQIASGGQTAEARRAAAVLDKCRAVVYTHDRLRDYLRDPRTLYRLRHDLAEVVADARR